MRIFNAYTGGAVGGILTMAVATFAPPEISLAVGSIAAIMVMLIATGRKSYALAGTVMFAVVAVGVLLSNGLDEAYNQTVLVSVVGLGVVSGLIVGARMAGRRIATALLGGLFGEEFVERLYSALSAAGGVIAIVWTVLTAHKKIVQTGGVAGVGTVTFVLNLLGIQAPIPIWILNMDINATMFLYIGAIIAGFHTLDTFHHTKRAAATSAKKGVEAAQSAAETARDASN